MLHELHSQGVALSTLYPATQILYRAVGYEQAGGRYEIRARCAELPRGREAHGAAQPLSIVRLERGDDPRVRAAYREVAQRSPGWLDRDEYMWSRVPEWRGEIRDGYAALAGHDVAGYLFVATRRLESGRQSLHLSDIAAVDAHAAERLFAFL